LLPKHKDDACEVNLCLLTTMSQSCEPQQFRDFRFDYVVLRMDDKIPEVLDNTPRSCKMIIDAKNWNIQTKTLRTSGLDALLRLPEWMRWQRDYVNTESVSKVLGADSLAVLAQDRYEIRNSTHNLLRLFRSPRVA
jgi:hypothetical protein